TQASSLQKGIRVLANPSPLRYIVRPCLSDPRLRCSESVSGFTLTIARSSPVSQFRRSTHLFTSESVTMGHPDKVADQISDAILDAILAQDPKSRVACETLVTTGQVVLAGEVTTEAYVDAAQIARDTIKEIGYTHPD